MSNGIWLPYRRVLEVTTVFGCSVDCYYCPQDAFKANYRGKPRLSLEDFNAALRNLPKDVIIEFAGFAEPFLNSDCTDMVESAVSQGFNVQLYTTLVGMREEDVRRISKLDLDFFCFHMPDNKGNAKIPITQEYKNVLALVLQNIRIDKVSVMNDNFVNLNNERAGLVRNAPKRNLKGPFNCGLLESPQFVMLPNCDVVLCCMDYGIKHVLGNILKQSYDDIVASPEYTRIRNNRYKMSGDIICRNCSVATPIIEYNLWKLYDKFVKTAAKSPNSRIQSLQRYQSGGPKSANLPK